MSTDSFVLDYVLSEIRDETVLSITEIYNYECLWTSTKVGEK